MKDAGLLTRYTILAGLIAGVGLTLVYLSLFAGLRQRRVGA